MRPGEKLYEELLISDTVTNHQRIMSANETMLSWHELSALLQQIEQACQEDDPIKIRQLF